MARKPVGIALSKEGNRETVFVVCDDGRVFYLNQATSEWDNAPSIPGTEADEKEEK